MANCNKLFIDFIDAITPSNKQLQDMKKSREALESKIEKAFKEQLGITISWCTQGSTAKDFRTIIIKADGTYDSDRGAYLSKKPEKTGKEVQEILLKAVKDHTDGGAKHLFKCIRIIYAGAYNIDMVIYYEVAAETGAYLARKDGEWVKDDPTQLIEWLKKYKDDNGQLIRNIRALKAWSSELSGKFRMPNGAALAIWAAKNFGSGVKDRDDKSLLQILEAIQTTVWFNCSCTSPVEPFDNLLEKMTDDDVKKFRDALDSFIKDARVAVNEPNQLKSSELWIKHLGGRFPKGEDADIDKREASLLATAGFVKNQSAKLNSQGKINPYEGVQHKEHRNYGS